MVQLMLSSACIKSRTFQSLMLCQQRGAQEAGSPQPGKLTQTIQNDIPYHRRSYSVYELWEVGKETPVAAQEPPLMGINQQVAKHSASLVSLGFYLPLPLSLFPPTPSSLNPFSLHYGFIIINITFQLLNCSFLNPQLFTIFSNSPPHPLGAGEQGTQLLAMIKP